MHRTGSSILLVSTLSLCVACGSSVARPDGPGDGGSGGAGMGGAAVGGAAVGGGDVGGGGAAMCETGGVVSGGGDDAGVMMAPTPDGGFVTASGFTGELARNGETYLAPAGGLVVTRRATNGDPVWTRIIDGDGAVVPEDVAVTTDGSVWLIGTHEGPTVDFGVAPTSGAGPLFLLRLGEDGTSEALWRFAAEGRGALAVTPDGGVVFGAQYEQTLDVGGVTLDPVPSSLPSSISYLVAKMSPTGSVSWARGFKGEGGALAVSASQFLLGSNRPSLTEGADAFVGDLQTGETQLEAGFLKNVWAAAMLPDGGYVAVIGGTPFSLRRYDAGGAELWQRPLVAFEAVLGDVTVSSSGTIAITGYFKETLTIDDQVYAEGSSPFSLYAATLDIEGSVLRVETLAVDAGEDPGVPYGTVAIDTAGGLIVGSHVDGELAMPSGPHATQGVDGFWARWCSTSPP